MFSRDSYGFLRVATAVPQLRVGNPKFNTEEIARMMELAAARNVRVLFLPELCITGYTCEDLFYQPTLQQSALQGLARIVELSKNFNGLVVPSLPLKVGDFLFNCPVAVHQGRILGAVPKAYLPERREFRENRWFAAAEVPHPDTINLLGQQVPFGVDLLFTADDFPELVLFLETCQDSWVTIPWNRFAILAGAKLIGNDSASTAAVGKAPYRRSLVKDTSAQYCVVAYAASGVWESTTDNVFDGHQLIGEYGRILAEGKRFQRVSSMLVADVDLQRVSQERLLDKSFADNARAMQGVVKFRQVHFTLGQTTAPAKLERFIDPHPFTPKDSAGLAERCAEIHEIQVNGLLTRLDFISLKGNGKAIRSSIGVSRGKDSMLAAEIARDAYHRLGWSLDNIHGFTMPGFGTPAESTIGAVEYMQAAGFTSHVVDIRPICFAQWLEEGFKPFGIDLRGIVAQQRAKLVAAMAAGTATEADLDVNGPALTIFCGLLANLPEDAQDLKFENDQARIRKEILQSNGFDIGTGNLLEMAQAWCTFLGDHASNYHVNCGIPKSTVIAQLVWLAGLAKPGLIKTHLEASVAEVVSAHLLPTGADGKSRQSTEKSIGPTELGEFFLENLIRWNMTPEKILYLAQQAAFDRKYTADDLAYWLASFIKRFFIANKRNCSPDGPQVGPVSLSPRCAFRMASDADVGIWLDWVNQWECDSPEAAARLNKILATAKGSFTTGATVRAAFQIEALTAPSTNAASGSLVTVQEGDTMPTPTVAAVAPAVDRPKRALLRVDILRGFCPLDPLIPGTGELPVPDAPAIVPTVNVLSALEFFDLIVDIQDFHPEDHEAFVDEHPGKKPFEQIDLHGVLQTLWTKHCVQNTPGCDFYPTLDRSRVTTTVQKGMDKRIDSNSGFWDNGKKAQTRLAAYLREQGVTQIWVVGFTRPICVTLTALDGVDEGFDTTCIVDACSMLTINPGDSDADLERMRVHGVKLVNSDEIPGFPRNGPTHVGK